MEGPAKGALCWLGACGPWDLEGDLVVTGTPGQDGGLLMAEVSIDLLSQLRAGEDSRTQWAETPEAD